MKIDGGLAKIEKFNSVCRKYCQLTRLIDDDWIPASSRFIQLWYTDYCGNCSLYTFL